MDVPHQSTLVNPRFWAKVEPVATGCWLWTGALDAKGYGACSYRYGSGRAHRVAWLALRGEIPAGLVIDHLCHVRRCVNPEHLRVATARENAENRSGVRSDNKSGHRGVMWYPRYGKWVAKVGHRGRVITVGYYEDVEKAAVAAAEVRQRLHSPTPEFTPGPALV